MKPVDLPLQQSRESLDLGLSETMVRIGTVWWNRVQPLAPADHRNPFKCPSSTLLKNQLIVTLKPEPGGDSSLVGLLDLYHPNAQGVSLTVLEECQTYYIFTSKRNNHAF